MSDHRGILYISPEFIMEALHIPEGTEILDVTREFGSDRIMLHVRHPALPDTPDGIRADTVHVMITEHHHETGPHRTLTSKWFEPTDSWCTGKPLEI